MLLLLIDIDHFKRVNDSLGHAAGDSVLVEMSKRIDACCRAGDIVARFGGEEFVLLLRDLEREDGPTMLQRCLASIAATPVQVGAQTLPITVSIGAVRFPDTLAGNDFDSALAVADDALYTAKQSGRDAGCLIDRGGDHVSLAGRPARLFRRDRGLEASPT